MRRTSLATALLLPVLVACGANPTTAHDPGGADAQADPVTLTVHHHWHAGKNGEMYIEGSVTTYSLTDSAGRTHRPTQQTEDTVVWADLEPGTYTLGSAERPCDANCGMLDPPVDPCEKDLALDHDLELALEVVVGQPCVIS